MKNKQSHFAARSPLLPEGISQDDIFMDEPSVIQPESQQDEESLAGNSKELQPVSVGTIRISKTYRAMVKNELYEIKYRQRNDAKWFQLLALIAHNELDSALHNAEQFIKVRQ